MMFDKKSLGARLRVARNGLSQKQAAAQIGQSQQAWGRWESGSVSPGAEILHQICSSFGVSADWLLGLPLSTTPTTSIYDSPGAIVASSGAKVNGHGTVINSPGAAIDNRGTSFADCENCKYKRLADAFKAL